MVTVKLSQKEKWILLALYAAAGHGLTAVQLQKSLFVFGRRRPKDVKGDYYDFRPYHYGPFDAQVYFDAERLSDSGLVHIDGTSGRSLRLFRLTASGVERAKKVKDQVPSAAYSYLAQVVAWAQRLTFDELVRAIYEAFPEMRENSVFRDPS